jgi:hypothetical protein
VSRWNLFHPDAPHNGLPGHELAKQGDGRQSKDNDASAGAGTHGVSLFRPGKKVNGS